MKTKRQVFGEAVLGITIIWLLIGAGIGILAFLAYTFGPIATLATFVIGGFFWIMTASYYNHLKGEYRKKGEFIE